MLSVENLSTRIGSIQILHDIHLHVNKGEIVSVIGANGAGKSTLLNTLSGLYKPMAGSIELFGEPIGGYPAHKVVGKGLALVPEGRQIFTGLTVQENLLLGMYSKYFKERKHAAEQMDKILEMFPALRKHLGHLGGLLSGGEQQMLAIGRALMSHPKILLLDEPSMGLAPKIVHEILENLKRIKLELDTMIILVEQNVKAALRVSDRVYIMEQGKIVLHGSSHEIADNPSVKAAYMGQTFEVDTAAM